MELLVKKGAQVNIKDNVCSSRFSVNHPCYYFSHHLTQAENCDGKSPLIVACWKGHGKIVSVLLGNGAQVDDQDKV